MYESCLFFELYQSDSSPYLQFFYKKSNEPNIPALNIPKCGAKCPLEKFIELYRNVLPTQSFEEECELHEGEDLPAEGNPENLPY